MKFINQTALHIVLGCFLLSCWPMTGCDSTPRPPIIEAPKEIDTTDWTTACVIRMHGSVFDVTYNDTMIECADMNDLDTALVYFGGSQIKQVVITWEGDVTYSATIDVMDELKKQGITNYTLKKAQEVKEQPVSDSHPTAIHIRPIDPIPENAFVIEPHGMSIRCWYADDSMEYASLKDVSMLLKKHGGSALDSNVVFKININNTKSNSFSEMVDTLMANGIGYYYCYLNVERYPR